MRLELSWAKPPFSWMLFNSPGEQRWASAAPTRCRELWWVQPSIALAHTLEGETKAGAQGLEAPGFARSTMGMSLWCPLSPQITPSYSCASQTDEKSSAHGIREAFGWVPRQTPSTVAGMQVALVLPTSAQRPLNDCKVPPDYPESC